MTYSDLGGLSSQINALGERTAYTYDALGRVLAESNASGSVAYTYDLGSNGIGRLGRVTYPAGSTAFTYDVRGNIASKSISVIGLPALQVFGYQYNFRDRVTAKTFPDNGRQDFEYRSDGTLTSIRYNGATYLIAGGYNAQRQIGTREIKSASGASIATTTNTFDEFDRLIRADTRLTSSGVAVQSYAYAYDDVGNLLSISDEHTRGSGDTTDDSHSLTYDALDRLESASGIYGLTSYTYDAAGRFTSKDGIGQTRSRNLSTGTWSIEGTKPSGELVFRVVHDAAGRRISLEDGSIWTNVWDHFARLTRVWRDSALVASFDYDYSGQRVRRIAGAVTTYYLSPDYELREHSASPGNFAITTHIEAPVIGKIATMTSGTTLPTQPTSGEVYANLTMQLAGSITGGTPAGTWYYVPNHLGSASVLLDADGVVIAREIHRPFGELDRDNSFGFEVVAHQYTAHEAEGESVLHYMGARYYDPVLGIFASPDSLVPARAAEADRYNRFAYVRNNPLRYFDPTGHQEMSPDQSQRVSRSMIPWYGPGYDMLEALHAGNYAIRAYVRDPTLENFQAWQSTQRAYFIAATFFALDCAIIGSATFVRGGLRATAAVAYTSAKGGYAGVSVLVDKIVDGRVVASVELRPYGGPGRGHHIPAKSAMRGVPGYDEYTALALPNDVLAKLGLDHIKHITPAQAAGYRLLAKWLGPNAKMTWGQVIDVETNALIAAGLDADLARKTVERAVKPLQDAGMEPARIPWGDQ